MEDYERMRERCRHAGLSRMTSLTAEKRKEVAKLGGIARTKKYFSQPERLLTIQPATRRLKVTTEQLLNLIEQGKLKIASYGSRGGMLFSVGEIERCKRETRMGVLD